MTFKPITSPSNPIFIELDLLKLKDIYQLKVGLAMRRMLREGSMANSSSLLINSHTHSTRSSKNNNCFIPTVRTNLGKSSINYQGPIIWNSIPKEIKSLSLYSFKKKFCSHLIKNYSYLQE